VEVQIIDQSGHEYARGFSCVTENIKNKGREGKREGKRGEVGEGEEERGDYGCIKFSARSFPVTLVMDSLMLTNFQ
jgi:hypothetical protein